MFEELYICSEPVNLKRLVHPLEIFKVSFQKNFGKQIYFIREELKKSVQLHRELFFLIFQ